MIIQSEIHIPMHIGYRFFLSLWTIFIAFSCKVSNLCTYKRYQKNIYIKKSNPFIQFHIFNFSNGSNFHWTLFSFNNWRANSGQCSLCCIVALLNYNTGRPKLHMRWQRMICYLISVFGFRKKYVYIFRINVEYISH